VNANETTEIKSLVSRQDSHLIFSNILSRLTYLSIYLSIYVCQQIFAAANSCSGQAIGCGLA